MIWLSLAMAAEVACPDVPPLLDTADHALLDVQTTEAQESLSAAEQALLRCREVFDRETLGRLWLLEGALRSVEGDQDAADDAFAASGRVSPDGWNPDYGPSMRSQYELARVRSPGTAKLVLVPELGGNQAWIDGARVDAEPIQSEAGLHALQVTDPTGVVLFSQVLYLPADDQMRLETGVPTANRVEAKLPEPTFVAVPVGPAPKKKLKPWVLGGGAAALLGGALFALSFERSAAMEDATDAASLRARYREHGVTRVGGLGLLGVGVGVLGYGFVF